MEHVNVSVIVPVYNGGSLLERCLGSFQAQTMPARHREIIFVDDGSTDDSPARLDRFADREPNVRVIHQANSGWPGKPRNVGIRAARGEYVQFLDQDDTLEPPALAALHAMGVRNRSDIVIGKVASDFRGVPTMMFARSRADVNIRTFNLMASLTPHKMFRTAFLREHGIEFPEGRRRLEDQLFMARAYFAAEHVSILADRVYYRYLRQPDRANTGSRRIDPDGYYRNLREVIDVVLASTEPGELRDGILRRFYTIEMLRRVSEPSFLAHDAQSQDELVAAIRALAQDVMTDGVVAGLGTVSRLRADLVAAGRTTDLATIAGRLSAVRAEARISSIHRKGDALLAGVTALLLNGTGRARLGVADGLAALDPSLTDGVVDQPVPLTEPVSSWLCRVTLVDLERGDEWLPGGEQPQVTFDAVEIPGEIPAISRGLRIDAGRVAGGRPLPYGHWALKVLIRGAGLDRSAIAVTDEPVNLRWVVHARHGSRRVTVSAPAGAQLLIEVDRPSPPQRVVAATRWAAGAVARRLRGRGDPDGGESRAAA